MNTDGNIPNEGLNFKKDPLSEIRAKQNAELFVQMAEELTNQEQPQPTVRQDLGGKRQPADEETIEPLQRPNPEMVRRNLAEKETSLQEKTKASLPMGPKYLSALDHVLEVADIRSIEVELPMLRTKAEVRPLTGEEEIALKTAAVSPASFLKKMDEILFTHTKFADKHYEAYTDFLSDLYPPDKSMLIWALMTASYLVLPTLETTCDACGESYFIDAAPSDMLHEDSIEEIWNEPVSVKDYVEIQTILGGYITFELSMPSEKDRLVITGLINPDKAKENAKKTGGILSYTDNLVFFTKTITVGKGDDRIVMVDVVQDIYPFMKNLPPKVADAVKNEIDVTIFNKYMPNFYINTVCKHCGNKEVVAIDPELAFFRKALSV